MSQVESSWLEKAISAICKVVLWVTSVVIFLILVANTLLRYSTGGSLQWANELPELFFPWLVMAGVVLAAVHGNHIATTFLMEAVAAPIRRVTGVLGWLVVAAMYGSLCWATYGMLEIVADERSPILQVPGSVTYICMLAGLAMLGLLAMQSAWRVLTAQISFPAGLDVDAASLSQALK